MRIKSKIITIEYAGQALLAPGEHISGQDYGGSRSFSTTAEDILNADTPTVRAYGNAQGSKTFDVCLDFSTEDEAIAEALTRLDFLEAHQTGTLTLTVGTVSRSWQAGVQSADWRISYTPDSVRLTLSYSFVLGGIVSASES